MLPPFITKKIRMIFLPYGWYGNYNTWEDVKKISVGYDQDKILQKVVFATKSVIAGEAAFERDSVLFEKLELHFPVLANLLYVYAQKNSLNVLDFGGSLGSLFFQHKSYLGRLENFSWTVVEQKHYVEYGKANIKYDGLMFAKNIDEAKKNISIDVVLLSSVLQYIEDYENLISELLKIGADYILIDRTPIGNNGSRLAIQKVPPTIYNASYPSWIFDENKLLSLFENYELKISYLNSDEVNFDGMFKGYFLERKK